MRCVDVYVQFLPLRQDSGRLLGLSVLHDRFDHFVVNAAGILEAGCKVALDMFESITISLKGSK